eukprot:c10230_g1_i2.p2 GENE.c10230_g1_i2~~c10230_g1_i2.p2  ORF type:complete len:202 (-),score=21.43 c10230_g1_i2:265-870(-)
MRVSDAAYSTFLSNRFGKLSGFLLVCAVAAALLFGTVAAVELRPRASIINKVFNSTSNTTTFVHASQKPCPKQNFCLQSSSSATSLYCIAVLTAILLVFAVVMLLLYKLDAKHKHLYTISLQALGDVRFLQVRSCVKRKKYIEQLDDLINALEVTTKKLKYRLMEEAPTVLGIPVNRGTIAAFLTGSFSLLAAGIGFISRN